MRDNVIQRAWDVIAEVRDRAPRLPNDASTDDIVNALHDAGLLAERPTEPDREALASSISTLRTLTECSCENGPTSFHGVVIHDRDCRSGCREAVEHLIALAERPADLDPTYRTQES